MKSTKEENVAKVLNMFPIKENLRADKEDQLRRVLNFYGLNENDVYETVKGQPIINQEA